MKTIHLIRHAKSSWADPDLSDKQRPLNARGEAASAMMAKAIDRYGCDFTQCFCSTATRAQQTIANIAKALPDKNIQWHSDDTLYTFNGVNLLNWCRGLDDVLTEIVLVGHNPALTDFCNSMTGADLENIPTCGYAVITFDIDHWQALKSKSATLAYFMTPKKAAVQKLEVVPK